MPAVHATATALLSHISELETRQRVVNMQMREVETKVQLATEEVTRRRGEAEQFRQREAELTVRAAAAKKENERLDLQVAELTADVNRARSEEPVLEQHAQGRLATLEGKLKAWQDEGAKLKGMQAEWAAATESTPLGKQIEAAEAEILKLRAQEEALTAMVGVTARNPFPSTPKAPSSLLNPQEEATRIQEQIKLINESDAEEAAQHALQTANLQRDVEATGARLQEMQRWVGEAETIHRNIVWATEQAAAAKATGVCAACSSNSNNSAAPAS